MKHFICLLLILPLFSISQQTVSGKVVNSKTQKGIPYATIGLIKKNIGTTAGKDGNFKLTTASGMQSDTLLISSTGYRPQQLAVTSFVNGLIELIEDTTTLDTVFVTSTPKKGWKTAKLNDFSHGIRGGGLGTNGTQVEVAVHLQLPGDDGFLKEVKISQGGIGAFAADKTIFRLKIYRLDTLTKGPSQELYSQLVEVKSDAPSITTKINLEQYQIYLPYKDFFVAVEWLKIPLNEINATGIAQNGTEQEILWYRPNINRIDESTGQSEIWVKSYKGTWRKQSDTGFNALAIAATVKY